MLLWDCACLATLSQTKSGQVEIEIEGQEYSQLRCHFLQSLVCSIKSQILGIIATFSLSQTRTTSTTKVANTLSFLSKDSPITIAKCVCVPTKVVNNINNLRNCEHGRENGQNNSGKGLCHEQFMNLQRELSLWLIIVQVMMAGAHIVKAHSQTYVCACLPMQTHTHRIFWW